MKKNILISGGGIAGLTAAKFLSKQGHNVTVIDKASSFNKVGFLISLKSFGVKIMDELGLSAKIQQESSPSEFVNFLEANDEVIQNISYEKMSENIERSVLISRGGLHHVLYRDIKDDVMLIFNTTINHLDQKENKTNVTLSDGKMIEADLVIISEGLRSPSREKYFKDCKVEDFNTLYMGGRLKQAHSYTVGTFKIYIDVNKMLSIYPIAQNEIAVQCYIHDTGRLSTTHENASDLFQHSFRGYSGEVQDLISKFAKNGIMFVDKMGMVNAPDLVNGNIVLLGDAGYCPTALSGMGASLSIYGAKALAYFLNRNPADLVLACNSYNALMQPIIKKFQTNAKNNASSFIPENKERLHHFVNSFRKASDADIKRIMTEPIVLTEEQINFIQ